jgi:hypothetical protein
MLGRLFFYDYTSGGCITSVNVLLSYLDQSLNI